MWPIQNIDHRPDLCMTQVVKNLPTNAGDARDMGSIPVSRCSPAVENHNPLQYSCLKNPRQSSLTVQFMVSQRVSHNWSNLAYTRPKNNFYISKWLKNRRRIFHDRWKLYEIQISISISLGPSHVHSFMHCLW